MVKSLGLDVPEFAVTKDTMSLDSAFPPFEGPYAMKIIAEGISHKSDLGGVALGITGRPALESAANEMRHRIQSSSGAELYGVMVQQMVARQPGDLELIVGGKRDPQFGPVVLVGHGGIMVEVLARMSLRTAPLTEAEIEEMLEELPGSEILKGVRGLPPIDRRSLKETIARVVWLMVSFPEIDSIDINPVLVSHSGARAIDARIFLREF